MPSALRTVLERAQKAGMLGPDDVDAHVAHALEFLAPIEVPAGARILDLGSGGGVPGLPLALAQTDSTWILLDAWLARCDRLERAIRALHLEDRVRVVHGRAEEVGRGALRAWADVVVARSFGPPPMTAECGAPLARDGGLLVVSTAESTDAWPAEVPELGLTTELAWSTGRGAFRSYRRSGALDDRYPRRPAAQRRRPLF